ncbi:MAG: hypothetical protein VX874_07435 [Pseudomonadota bacterium]|nr:hypothetical protein [Pseudomonadota bacterium]
MRSAIQSYNATPRHRTGRRRAFLTALCAALVLLIFDGAKVTAAPLDPAETSIGLDIDITAATLDMRVNDVPVFTPGAPFGSDATITTHIPLNPAFRQGRNTVTLTLTPRADPVDGFEPAFRARLLWKPAGQPTLPFAETEHAIAVTLDPAASDGPRLVSTPGSQKHVTVAGVETATHADETVSFDFVVDIDLALPPFAWQAAEPLVLTSEAEAGIRAAFARLHAALARGDDTARRALAPYIARQAAAIGVTPDQFFDASLAPLFQADTGFEILGLDPNAGTVQQFGNGRLAALMPSPLVFDNLSTGQQATLLLYVWQDAKGDWRVIH